MGGKDNCNGSEEQVYKGRNGGNIPDAAGGNVKIQIHPEKVCEGMTAEEEMQNIRGIGGAKARAVCEVIKSFFERKVAGPDETGSEISGE